MYRYRITASVSGILQILASETKLEDLMMHLHVRNYFKCIYFMACHFVLNLERECGHSCPGPIFLGICHVIYSVARLLSPAGCYAKRGLSKLHLFSRLNHS
jgi:hypothetical protein